MKNWLDIRGEGGGGGGGGGGVGGGGGAQIVESVT